MEFIFEFIFEFLFESSIEVSKSKKVSKYIRYPLIALISLFFIAVIGLIFYVGIIALKESVIAGIVLILIGLYMIIASIIKLRKVYLSKTNNE